MGLTIGSAADNNARWKSPVRLYTTEAGQIVEAGAEDAVTLFMAEGAEIALKDAQRFGLTERFPQVNVVVDEATTVPRAELNEALEKWATQVSGLQQGLHEAKQEVSDALALVRDTQEANRRADAERDTAQDAAKRSEAENVTLRAELTKAQKQLAQATEKAAQTPDAPEVS